MGKKEDIIEIVSQEYIADWVQPKTHRVNLNDIRGFDLHWRLDDWHVVVITKEVERDGKHHVSYELSNWVGLSEVIKLIQDPRVTIREIVNFHRSKNFISEVAKLAIKNS